MEFVHKPYDPEETIAAIATPAGEGAVAMIRVSGAQALEIVSKVFTGPIHTYKTHTAHVGKIIDKAQNVIDEVLVLVMHGKRSFTGDNTVEIYCHGGSLVTRRVLEAILRAGARPAKPGEFSFKAFMNGKIDLSQAEAIQELISAKNETALKVAEDHLEGSLSRKIKEFQKELFDIAAILEAWVDFPEEGIEFASMEEIIFSLEKVNTAIKRLLQSFEDGSVIKNGLSLCLAGPPNVGKSSLMNALSGREKAIVTDIPGTTRDILEEEIRLGGLHFRLLDTAGLRETNEPIEKEGIKRSTRAMQDADLILLVMDATRGLQEEDLELLSKVPKEKAILVWNKIDLPHPELNDHSFTFSIKVSAKELSGIAQLKRTIEEMIWKKGPPSKEEVVITNLRHKNALEEAMKALESLIQGLQNQVSPEFLSSDMRKALIELGTIIGSNITEDILSAIFSKFCIGK